MHNSGILERLYWANKKILNCENMKEKIIMINKEAGKSNQTQLKSPGRNIGGEEKYRQSSEKRYGKTQRSKSALKISPRRNVVGERRKKRDQS